MLLHWCCTVVKHACCSIGCSLFRSVWSVKRSTAPDSSSARTPVKQTSTVFYCLSSLTIRVEPLVFDRYTRTRTRTDTHAHTHIHTHAHTHTHTQTHTHTHAHKHTTTGRCWRSGCRRWTKRRPRYSSHAFVHANITATYQNSFITLSHRNRHSLTP
jgi:ABC-type nickel/cobalt efflux system permease component RcnA